MDKRRATRIRKLRRDLSLTGAIVAVSVGVLLPVLLSTFAGILLLAIGSSTEAIVLGILVVCFTAAAIGGGVVTVSLLGRRARIARAESDLLANVTHELRTPLTAIRLHAQTLASGILSDDPEATRGSVETIVRETERLDDTIDRILTWRASSRDRGNPELRSGPINPAVELAVLRFRRMVRADEVRIETDLQSERLTAHDPDSVGSIVTNLLVNAFKYSTGDRWIRVSTRDEDDRVVVAVSDNGIGIPKREFGRIFDPFHRVDNRLRAQASGAGLGLAIVRHLMAAHAGEVFVESEEGRGSTFSLRFPAVPDDGGGV